MGYPTKVQVIRRQDSAQWYINFPAALAQALEFAQGETVEWVIQDRGHLLLSRVPAVAAAAGKKNARPAAGRRAAGGRPGHPPALPAGAAQDHADRAGA